MAMSNNSLLNDQLSHFCSGKSPCWPLTFSETMSPPPVLMVRWQTPGVTESGIIGEQRP